MNSSLRPTEAVEKSNMLSVLVFFTGALIADAGITHQPKFVFNQQHPSSHSVRPVVIRSNIASPIRLGTSLNTRGPFFKNTFLTTPTVFNSAQIKHAIALQKFHLAPVSKVVIGSASTITHISPPLVLNTAAIDPSITSNRVLHSQVYNSPPVSHAIKALAPTSDHELPLPSTVLKSASISETAIRPGLANDHKLFYPNVHGNKMVQEDQGVPEKSVSYSISENDYQFLKHYKTEGLVSPYDPDLGLNTASPKEIHQNTHSHHDKNNDVASHKPREVLDVKNVLKSNAASNVHYQGYTQPNSVNVPEPVVTKHVYFHVPQPDMEEPLPASVKLPTPRKTYNILFIKVPAQEQQNLAYLQQVLQSKQPQIEDKTLIYVLSKKQDPDPVQVVVPPPKISSPEVFFVKYQTKLGDLTNIRNELVEGRLHKEISPDLKQNEDLETIRRIDDHKS